MSPAVSKGHAPGTEVLMASAQINNRLQPSTMPLMSLAATAIDQARLRPLLSASLVSRQGPDPI